MLKNYLQFLYEAGLDLGGLGDLGGDEKKEPPPDPEKEIAKKKKEQAEKEEKARDRVVARERESIEKAMPHTSEDFRREFEEPIMKAVKDDNRVEYHGIILNIQRYQIPLAKDGMTDEIDKISPIVAALQNLNKNEYKG
jgi:hypothetical protein